MSEAGRQATVELGIHNSAPFSIRVEGETVCYEADIAETLVIHRETMVVDNDWRWTK